MLINGKSLVITEKTVTFAPGIPDSGRRRYSSVPLHTKRKPYHETRSRAIQTKTTKPFFKQLHTNRIKDEQHYDSKYDAKKHQ